MWFFTEVLGPILAVVILLLAIDNRALRKVNAQYRDRLKQLEPERVSLALLPVVQLLNLEAAQRLKTGTGSEK